MPPVNTGFKLLDSNGGNWCRSLAAAVYEQHFGKTQSVKLLFREAAQMWFAEVAVHFLVQCHLPADFPQGFKDF